MGEQVMLIFEWADHARINQRARFQRGITDRKCGLLEPRSLCGSGVGVDRRISRWWVVVGWWLFAVCCLCWLFRPLVVGVRRVTYVLDEKAMVRRSEYELVNSDVFGVSLPSVDRVCITVLNEGQMARQTIELSTCQLT